MDKRQNTIHINQTETIWSDFTENDDAAGAKINGGLYSLTIEGAFGGASIEWEYAKVDVDGNYHTIDIDNLVFTSSKTYNVQLGRGFIRPKRTGGTSTNVTAYASPIPVQ
tara:strand:+ start:9521 stop:9850 length:330 start_codon:yes stop_codon:yes gene_type:complete